MRYIFLDTESANCFNNTYKLCEYGFVISDENLNAVPGGNKDVVVNPGEGRGARFNLTGRKGGRDLILAHSEDEYKAAKTFDFHYDNLKFLLNQKDVRIFLWAGENDIRIILDNCYRYRLPKIAFASYDVQVIYKRIVQPKARPSLEKAMSELGLSCDGIVAHRPDDDSKMTLMILKALCEKTGKNVENLIAEFPECRRESIPAYEEMRQRHKAKVQMRITDEKEKARLRPYNDELNALYAQKYEEECDLDKLFAVSVGVKRHVDATLEPIKKWISSGYRLKGHLAVKYLVAYDEEEVRILKEKLDTTNLTIVTMKEFESNVIGV